ncbi:histidine phosphatase family protein [Puniceicoccus vermicola]|uniref:Histidine phosphatase family protein n=1 Tax=Puniceicoccus vermicola TaxID=388746 RepID=A0A7X1E2T7_9BACT|nr:histidine phosphatase family protein [Puniceicoccus vermicola]
MRELILIRHAKSGWEHPHLNDFDRPLDDRGLRDAPKMAKRFGPRWDAPDLLISSPAIRAYQTSQFFREEWNLPWERYLLQDAIYEATPETLLAVLQQFDDQAQRIALVGHNPGISSLLHLLSGEDKELKTTCIARLTTSQKSFAVGECEFVDHHSPQMY